MNEFIKYLRKSFNNKRGKKAEDECERVLGLNGKVNEFATFYEKHEDDLLIVVASALENFSTSQTYTKEELAFYKLALTELPLFMDKCVKERDRKLQEAVNKIQQVSIEQ